MKLKLLVFLAVIMAISVPYAVTNAQAVAIIVVTDHAELGNIITDETGRTLYLFTNDERGKSNCSGGCATAWPPLTATGDPVAGDGITESRLGTTTRDDGSTQVTYNGWPLYYFANDAAPGHANGQNRGDVWYVLSSHGGPVQNNAPVSLTENATLGSILTETSGRTLYLFTNDERNVSNCTGGCAGAWPPLVTIGDPVAGEGVAEGRLGTITREDGYTQVTYNGWPLYYFANDAAPGDSNGQDRGTVWFVVSGDGGAIQTSPTVNVSEVAGLGSILTETSGRTLYMFVPDEPNKSNCNGPCALSWPPLRTIDAPTAGDGSDSDLIGTTTRDDGSKQVTYNDMPLYYFANDARPGDTNGQNRGEVWFVVAPDGTAIMPEAPELPVTGDPMITTMALAGLIGAMLLLSSGGVVLVRSRARK
ncbi:MAG: hypothetical protein O3A47_12155 [Chloroflexi bacterium]|nr:hypothetical protein [Chloroflexota bacterium]